MLPSYVATACEGIGNIQNALHDHPPVVGCLVCPWHPFFVPYIQMYVYMQTKQRNSLDTYTMLIKCSAI